MALNIRKPFWLNEQGKRANNEDSIFPRKGYAQLTDRLFMVCDGVGGSEKGEIASNLLSTYIHDYFTDVRVVAPNLVDAAYVEQAIRYAEQKMVAYIRANPNSRGMATTLTLLFIADNSALIAWIGDSRVYYVSPANPQNNFITADHSLVAQLIASGNLTEEEAKDYPQKSTILRAVTGSDPAKADFKVIPNLYPNDYFLLCSDGILESFDSKPLQSTLMQSDNTEEYNYRVTEKIFKNCQANSRDNFSMYLVQIESADEQLAANDAYSTAKQSATVIDPIKSPPPVFVDAPPPPLPDKPTTTVATNTNYRRRTLYVLLPVLLFALVIGGLAYLFKDKIMGENDKTESPKADNKLEKPTEKTPIVAATNVSKDTMLQARKHRKDGEYAIALKKCNDILQDTPEYLPAQKLADTLKNEYFALVIQGDDLTKKEEYKEAIDKYDEAQEKYKKNKNLATEEDFKKVQQERKDVDNLFKEQSKHKGQANKPQQPSTPTPATEQPQNKKPTDNKNGK